MGINRRNFLQALGITGLTMATGSKLNASSDEPEAETKEFYGVLYDSTLCKGCRGCEFDCAIAHDLPMPPDEVEPIRKTDETYRTVVNDIETSKGLAHVKIQCMHCNEPACVAACLTQAMYKTEDGAVIWREDKCMGCRYCMISCPFDIPKFEFDSPNPIIQKCTMCYETSIQMGEPPACAYNCPTGALLFGKRRELIDIARKRLQEKPELYVNHIYGEHEAGGTGWLYISSAPFEELGLNTSVKKESYPAFTKGFLYSVPSVFVLVPALLLGIRQSTKDKSNDQNEVNNNE
jgi:Fe-S-cluster-containing dehydrogenase component